MVGQLVGLLIFPAIFIISIVKCLTMLRRPHVCKPCVIALAILLLAWLCSIMLSMATRWLPEWPAPLTIIGSVLLGVMVIAAIIMAIVGLALYDSRVHLQGRAQAIWTLVICSIFVLVGASSLFVGQVGSNIAPLSSPGKTVINEEFNCLIEMPPRWVETKPSTINELACIALRRSRPEAYVMVIGEHLDGEIELEAYMDSVKANMAASATSVEEDHTTSATIDGMPFLRRSCIVKTDAALNIPMYFEQWVTAQPGYCWQIHLWGPSAGRKSLESEFNRIAESFRVLKKERAVPASALVKNVESLDWGYQTKLGEDTWKAWTDIKERTPLADFAALRPLECVVVIPVNLGPQPPELEAAAAGLLARLEIPFPSDDWHSKPWPNEWGEGLEVSGSRDLDSKTFLYKIRIAQKGPRALLIGGWYKKEKGSEGVIDRAFASITLMMDAPGVLPEHQPAQKETLGLVCNDIGLWYYNRQKMPQAAEWCWRGFGQTQADPAMLGNALDAWHQAGKTPEALAKLGTEIMPKFSQASYPNLMHARLLAEAGHDAEAEKAFLTAVKAGIKEEDSVLSWLQLLNSAEKYALAEKSAEAWMKQKGDLTSRRWHAQTVSYNDDPKRAVELLTAMAKEFPDDRRVPYDLGETLNEAGEHVQAAEVAQKILAERKDSARALMILGWSQMGRKWYREAKESFEKALKIEPDAETAQSAVRRASAMLGQGNNTDIKTPIEAVKIPESIQKAMTENPPKLEDTADRPLTWLLTAKGCHFEKGRPLRCTWHVKVRVENAEGAAQLSSVEHSFDPLNERLFINRVEVRDDKGKVVTSAPGDAYVMDEDNGMGTHDQKLHFQVAGLRPGCTLEYELSQESRFNSDTFEFNRHQLSECAADIVFVTGDVKEVAFAGNALVPGLTKIQEEHLIAWMGFNLPQNVREPHSVPFEERVPAFSLAPKEGTWAEVGEKSLGKDLAGRLAPEPEIVALAKQLTGEGKSERDKISALTRHVQKAISYTAIEFGTRARRPNPAAQTLDQKYGDCKDQALLLHQLLTAAGVRSHLALVHSHLRVQPTLPTLDQFNHMVVHVPSLGPGFLIDTTNKNLDAAAFHADDLWHSHALILEEGKCRLIEPAKPAVDSAHLLSQRRVKPEGDGWHVEESLTLTGYCAAWMRSAFAGKDAAKQLQNAQSILAARAPTVQVHQFSFPDLDDPTKPARIELAYDVPGRLHDEGGQRRGVLPALWEEDYLNAPFVKDRQNPFRFTYPITFDSEVTLTGMSGLPEDSLKELTKNQDGPFCIWKVRSESVPDASPTLLFHFAARPGDFPAADYKGWQEAWNAALRHWQRPLQWKP